MAKIKICGLCRPEDVSYVNEAKPDYAGFVFAPSRRRVTPEQAALLSAGLSRSIVAVGVFVDARPDEIVRLYQLGIITVAQLHGSEDEAYIRRLKELCGIPVIKALRVKSREGILARRDTQADYLLLDSGAGTGMVFDWSLIPALEKPCFLAGGIREENLADALARSPYCVDVSSGAENDGVKDREKILRLVRAVRRQ